MVNLDEAFAQVWAVYPRREKKIASRDMLKWALQNHNGDGQLIGKIVAALAWQFDVQPEWKYWTTLDRWLWAQRWEDERPLVREKVIEPTAAERMAYTQWVRSVGPFVAKDRTLVDWVRRQRGAA
jgi:hypothetical protein